MGKIYYNNVAYGGGGGSDDNSIILTQAEYNALPQSEKEDTTKIYYISDAQIPGGAIIDDTTTALNKVWSSSKTSTEIAQASGAQIDDTTTANNKVWSSSKTSTEITNNRTQIDDTATASDKVWSSQKTASEISQAGGAEIDDTTTANNKVWSSSKTSTEIANNKVQIDDTATANNKVWSSSKTSTEIANNSYTLPTATSSILGGVKVLSKTESDSQAQEYSRIYIDSNGILRIGNPTFRGYHTSINPIPELSNSITIPSGFSVRDTNTTSSIYLTDASSNALREWLYDYYKHHSGTNYLPPGQVQLGLYQSQFGISPDAYILWNNGMAIPDSGKCYVCSGGTVIYNPSTSSINVKYISIDF